jgi:hypothetical protein
MTEDDPAKIIVERELAFLISVVGYVAVLFHFVKVQVEMICRSPSSMMVPLVGKEDSPYIDEKVRDGIQATLRQ